MTTSTAYMGSIDGEKGSLSAIWVVTLHPDDDVVGRLGDARDLADRLDRRVSVLAFRRDAADSDAWIAHGADRVHVMPGAADGQGAAGAVAADLWRTESPFLVVAPADRIGRAWSARLAARLNWNLVSPALMIQATAGTLVATSLDVTGGRARRIELDGHQPAIIGMRPGVAQPLSPDTTRQGVVTTATAASMPVHQVAVERIPADPATADIRHLPRLVSGGRGVGGREGFERLQRIANKLDAGVAASRMAVDLGWIEYARQVGQTGKSVKPELYIACGISGASHHLEGMSDSRCIVAINTDPKAPLLQRAHLSIVGDLHEVLKHLESELERTA